MTLETTSVATKDIHDATTLDGLGWRLSLQTFRAIRVLGVLAALCSFGLGSAIAFDWLGDALLAGGSDVAVLGAMAVGLYALVLHTVREALTTRRIQLTQHPLGDFFRAMDIPRHEVVIAESRDRLQMLSAIVVGVCGGVASRAASAGLHWTAIAALAMMPVAVISGAFAVTAIIAVRVRASRRPRVTTAVLGGIVAGIVLTAIVRFGAVTISRETDRPVFAVWPAAALIVLIMLIVFLVAAASSFRALGRSSFMIGNAEPEARAEIQLRTFRGPSPWIGVVVSDLSPVPRAAFVSRMFFLIWGGAIAVTGIQMLVLEPLGWAAPAVAVDLLSGVVSFLIGITLAEMLSRWIGPAALSARWRAAWEAGADPGALAVAPLGVAVVAGSLAVLPIAVASAAVGGDALIVVAVMWSALACAWIAAAVVPSEPPRSDGSAPTSISAGLFCVVASAAMVVIALMTSAAGVGWVGFLLSAFLLGGATWVTRSRILSLPSRPLV